jgi:hypothetical protein
MIKSAEGIVEKATMFSGVVHRHELARVALMDYVDEPIKNTKCRITFEDGQTMEVESDEKGIVEFYRKAQGEIKIEVLEEDEANIKSSGGKA